MEIIEKYQPKRIITVHQSLNCINFDGPAIPLAKRLSELTGLPIVPEIGYDTLGSLGTYAGLERGIPAITLELSKANYSEKIWEQFKDGLLESIRFKDF